MNKQINLICIFFSFCLLAQPATGDTGDTPKAFVKGSFAEIIAAKAGKPFILSLWSLDCPPCIHELKLWPEIHARYPDLDVVLISTDGMDAGSAINSLLLKTANQQRESWVFADEFMQRLRFEIDPQWYGELPRTIFFAADHSRQSVSGLLKRQTIEQWLRHQAQ